jgi:Tol biopolymer transport system component
LVDSDAGALYTPSGHLLFIRQGTLFAQAFDPARLTLGPDPRPVAEQVTLDPLVAGSVALSASAAGPIAYRTRPSGQRRQFVWFDRSGHEIGRVGDPESGAGGSFALSPDGRRLAFARTLSGNADVWLLDIERGVSSRFTFDAANDLGPLWSPDGNRIIFGSIRTGGGDLYQKSVSAGGTEEPLLTTPLGELPTDWSADGRHVLYQAIGPNSGWDIWALSLEGDRKPISILRTDFDEREGQFSPDGKWISYNSNKSGRVEVYLRPFAGPGGEVQVSNNGGAQSRWSRDGNELFYLASDGRLMAAPIRLAADGRVAEAVGPVPMFTTRLGRTAANPYSPQYVVSSDGRRFLLNVLVEDVPAPITLLLNWRTTP